MAFSDLNHSLLRVMEFTRIIYIGGYSVGMTSEVRQKIDKFFAPYRLQRFDEGHMLVQAGDNPSGIFYLTSGHVRMYDITEQGDEIVVNVFQAPSFFPMGWAINNTVNQYFFEAATDINLRVAPANETVEFLKANPDVTFDLLSRIYSGLEGILRRTAHLMGGNARTRLLYELLVECRRFGHPQPGGGHLIKLHEDELAARAGLSRETISRELRKIKKLDLIEVSRQGFHVRDCARLEKELGTGL